MTKPQDDIRSRLFEVVTPVCEHAGYELVDLRYVREQNGWVLRVFIDRLDPEPDQGGIGFADCEDISRELSAVLDVEDLIPQAYSLEVSSPGLDRPLRLARHFRRFAGQTAKIALGSGVDGRRNFTGQLQGFDDAAETIRICVDNTVFDLPLRDLRSAKLIPDWDAVLKAGTGQEIGKAGTGQEIGKAGTGQKTGKAAGRGQTDENTHNDSSHHPGDNARKLKGTAGS